MRKGVRFRSFMIGGRQERGRWGGTENAPGIIALGKAAELAQRALAEEGWTASLGEAGGKERMLRDRLEQGLFAAIPDCELNGHPTLRLPNTTNIGFKYVEGEAILLSLDQHGICASSGSACTSGSLDPSHVLKAMGAPYTLIHGSIRFSLSRYTTEAEIDQVLAVMPEIIAKLRAISPFRSEDEGQGWLREREQELQMQRVM